MCEQAKFKRYQQRLRTKKRNSKKDTARNIKLKIVLCNRSLHIIRLFLDKFEILDVCYVSKPLKGKFAHKIT